MAHRIFKNDLSRSIPLGRAVVIFLFAVFFLPGVSSSQTYTWKNVVVPAGGYVSGIDYSPVAQGLVYARTDMGGAYRWDNANNVWVPLTDMFSDWNLYGIESIAPDPKNANVVYAAIGQTYNGTNGYIIASTNQGNSWTQYNIGVIMGGNADGRNAGERLAVDPNLTSKLYFASRNSGLWVSTNSAAAWAKVTGFPVNGDANYGLSCVIFDTHGVTGTASATIYVGVEAMNSGNSNIYRSTNAGANWALVAGGPTNMVPPHASLGTDGTLWINYDSGGYGPGGITNGQVWKLNTATSAWTNVTPAGGPPGGSGGYGGISVDAQNAQHVVVTTLDWYAANDKVLSTTNGGGAWVTIGNVSTGWNAGPFANYNNNGAIWTRFCTTYDGGAVGGRYQDRPLQFQQRYLHDGRRRLEQHQHQCRDATRGRHLDLYRLWTGGNGDPGHDIFRGGWSFSTTTYSSTGTLTRAAISSIVLPRSSRYLRDWRTGLTGIAVLALTTLGEKAGCRFLQLHRDLAQERKPFFHRGCTALNLLVFIRRHPELLSYLFDSKLMKAVETLASASSSSRRRSSPTILLNKIHYF